MAKVTYLLGAGASAEAIPVVEKFNEGVMEIKDLLNEYLKENLNEQAYSRLPEILQQKNDILEKIVSEFDWLLKEADNHQTIDTLAKKFYLTDSSDLKKLKLILIIYFQIRQALSQPDKRYDSFFAAISTKNDGKISLSKTIKILTWNYDVQLELSIKRYINETINWVKEKFQIFPNNSSSETDVSTIIDANNFAVIKINGNAFWSKPKQNGSFPPNALDKCFGRYYSKELIIAEILNEYDQIFNNTNEGNTYLRMFNFAWEHESDFNDKYSGYDGNLNTAESISANTEILVVIGYSFPVFNRKIDSRLFNSMPNLKKIYIQDKDPERIKSTMTNAFKCLQPPFHRDNPPKPFQLETSLNQFVIPYEL